MRRKIPSWALILGLASCTVGPDFTPPKPPEVAKWNDRSAQPSRHASPVSTQTNPDPNWWNGFKDPTLTVLIQRAISGNLSLQQAVVRIVEAQQGEVSARAAGLPAVNGSGSYMREQLGLRGLLLSQGVPGEVKSLGAPRRDGDYTMADIGLAAFSIFFMGSPSFLGHQQALAEGHGRSNCETLFGMSAIPSDNYIRLMLDGASPAAFDGLFVKAIEAAGLSTVLCLDGRVPIALDGASTSVRARSNASSVRHGGAPMAHRILPRLPGASMSHRPQAGPAPAAGIYRAADVRRSRTASAMPLNWLYIEHLKSWSRNFRELGGQRCAKPVLPAGQSLPVWPELLLGTRSVWTGPPVRGAGEGQCRSANGGNKRRTGDAGGPGR